MDLLKTLEAYFVDRDYLFVLLFGSYSDQSAHTMSDVDIGLFFRDEPDYMRAGYESAVLESRLEKRVDIVVLNDIYKKDPSFAFEILQNHTPIVVSDEKSYIDFKRRTQLSYLDHKPLIEANRSNLLKRIENDKIGERNFAEES